MTPTAKTAFAWTWQLTLLAGVFVPPVGVDTIEVNRCVNQQGEPRFVQSIAWQYGDSSMPHVCWWEMTNDGDRIVRTANGVTLIRSKMDCYPSVIRARRATFTETSEDPEENDRWVLPVDEREGIR